MSRIFQPKRFVIVFLFVACAACSASAPGQSIEGGRPFPDFRAKDAATGRTFSLSDFRGRVVLIDFWATWCGPCRAELPNVTRVYEQFHDRGFEIISISLDSNRAKFSTFIRSHNMDWHHVMDGGGWNTRLAKQFGIRSIPAMYLVDHEGVCISTNARGSRLAERVERAIVAAENDRGREPLPEPGEAGEMEEGDEGFDPEPFTPTAPEIDPDIVMNLRHLVESSTSMLLSATAQITQIDQRLATAAATLEGVDAELPSPRDPAHTRERYETVLRDLRDLREELFVCGMLNDRDVSIPESPFAGATGQLAFARAKQELPLAQEAAAELRKALAAAVGDIDALRREIEEVERSLSSGRGDAALLQSTCASIDASAEALARKWSDPWKTQLGRVNEMLAEVAQPLTDAIGMVDALDAVIADCRTTLENVDPESDASLESLRDEVASVCEAVENASRDVLRLGIIESIPADLPHNPYDGRRLRDRRALAETGAQLDRAAEVAATLRESAAEVSSALGGFESRAADMQQTLRHSASNARTQYALHQQFERFCADLLAFRGRFLAAARE